MTNLETSDVALPVFGMNGNLPDILGNEYFASLRALDTFARSFTSIQFHDRDYYMAGAEHYSKARENRVEMLKHIEALRKYLEVHAEHCFSTER
jgi:hypothetical protein